MKQYARWRHVSKDPRMYVANWPEVVLNLVGSLPVRSVVCGRGRSVSEGEDTEMKLRRHLFQQLRRLKARAAIVVLPLRHDVVYRSCRASRQRHRICSVRYVWNRGRYICGGTQDLQRQPSLYNVYQRQAATGIWLASDSSVTKSPDTSGVTSRGLVLLSPSVGSLGV